MQNNLSLAASIQALSQSKSSRNPDPNIRVILQNRPTDMGAIHPNVPWDILIYLLTFLDHPRALLQYMRVCQTLWTSGMPVLLHTCKVPEHYPRALSFCQFTFQSPDRLLFLRSLTVPRLINAPARSPFAHQQVTFVRQAIAHLIAHAANLRVLHVRDLYTYFPDGVVAMSDALCSLRNLHDISLTGVEGRGADILMSMHAPVQKAHISMKNPMMPDESLSVKTPALLTNFSQHLQHLTVYHPYDFTSVPNLRFPFVTSLFLDAIGDCTKIKDLVPMFPNLTKLRLYTYNSWIREEGSEIRRKLSLATPYQGWPSLDTLRCSVDWAYALGIQTRVRLWTDVAIMHPHHLHTFRTGLQDLRPRHLEMSLHKLFRIPHELFEDLFPPSDVTHLKLDVVLDGDEVQLMHYFSSLALAIEKLSLEIFVLQINFAASIPPNGDSLRQQAGQVQQDLKNMDVKRYVQLLGLRNARLRQVHVNFEHDQQPEYSWDIERGADSLLKVQPVIPDKTSWSQFFGQAD